MEITEGCLLKFDVAKLIIKPPIREGDVMDIEMLLVSDIIPVSIEGYVSIDGRNNYFPRSYGSDPTTAISVSAKRRLRVGMKQLATQIRGELNNG
jgi:hypothetical protein